MSMRAVLESRRNLIMPAFLLGGFLLDVISFKTLDLTTTFALLAVHAAVVATAMVLEAASERRWIRRAAPYALQLSLGALVSSSLLFYWFSGAFSASWPAMLVLTVLGVTNEKFQHWYLRTDVRVGAFAFVLFSYFAMLVPYLTSTIAPWTFAAAGSMSTALALLLAHAVTRAHHNRAKERKRHMGVALAVSACFATLYVLNVIPPVPLAIREAGIYNDVVRQGSGYILTGDTPTLLERVFRTQTIHGDADGRVYAFTAIFAPAALNTEIVHRWLWYDPETGAWKDAGSPSYETHGGREGGYRGYTYKTNLQSGRWRVIVETSRGQVLGTMSFTYLP